jgi:DNA replication protein DnaC
MMDSNKYKRFVGCRKGCCMPDHPGFREVENEDAQRTAVECERHVEWRTKRELFAKFIQSGFRWDLFELDYPNDYVGFQSIKSMQRVVNYVKKFPYSEEVRKCLVYLYGPNGTQKTLMGNYIGSQLIQQGYDVKFILMNTLIKNLTQESYNDDVRLWLEKLAKADLLVLDEAFDIEKVSISMRSGYQLPFFDTFIRQWINNKGIVMISNKKIEDIPAVFGSSLQNLVKRRSKYATSALEFLDNWADIKSLEGAKDIF